MSQLVLAVAGPYMIIATFLTMSVAIIFRRKVAAFASLVALILGLCTQAPWYISSKYYGAQPYSELRILSLNLRKGQADAQHFVDLAKNGADVITVSELTSGSVQRLSAAGINASFPYAALVPAPGATGKGLWSRFPIAKVELARHQPGAIVAVRLGIPGQQLAPLVVSLHITSPLANYGRSFDEWRGGIRGTAADLADFANIAGQAPVIAAGDFNSTPDMWQFRDLFGLGYRDSAEEVGAGWGPTFPSNQRFPPLITIDHVLTRNAVTESLRTVTVPGSDHRALLASIRLPLAPATQ